MVKLRLPFIDSDLYIEVSREDFWLYFPFSFVITKLVEIIVVEFKSK
jgi:hypothetical protein